MELSPAEEYLQALAQKLDELAPAFVPCADERLTLDELVRQDFQRVASVEIAAVAQGIDRLAVVNDQIEAFEGQRWFRRWHMRSDLAQLYASRGMLDEALHIARNRLAIAEHKHRTDQAAVIRTHQRFEELGYYTEHRQMFEQLRQIATDLQHQVLQAQLIYGRNNVCPELPTTAPPLRSPKDVPAVLAFLEAFAYTLPSALERGAIDLAGAHDAQEFLQAMPVTHAEPFDTASAKTLRGLLSASNPDQPSAYVDLVHIAMQPDGYRKLEAWLVFWTSEAARRSLLAASRSALPSLSDCVDTWCGAWQAQSSRWSPGTLRRFAAGNEAIPCRHFFLRSAGALVAKHDALIVLNVAASDRAYCSIAGMHFISDAAQAVNREQECGEERHPSTTAALQARYGERWRGLLVRCPASSTGLLDVTASSFNHAAIRRTTSTGAPVSEGDGDNQSLSAALAAILTANNGNAFLSLDDAFRWLEETAGLPLPQHLIVISPGRSEQAMAQATQAIARLAQRRGAQYDVSPAGESPPHGHQHPLEVAQGEPEDHKIQDSPGH